MNPLRRYLPEPIVMIAVALAFLLFGATFRGPRARFWQRMTGTGLTLGSLSLIAEPKLRRTRFGPREAALGLGSAGVLYIIFQIGDRLARLILPRGSAEIGAIYGLEKLRPRPELAARLAFLIGPAEELFWRGLVQARLVKQFGLLPGYLMSTIAYGGAHLITGNFTLIGAATVAGAFWGGLAALGVPPGALIISHSLWDVFIFLIAPTTKKESGFDEAHRASNTSQVAARNSAAIGLT